MRRCLPLVSVAAEGHLACNDCSGLTKGLCSGVLMRIEAESIEASMLLLRFRNLAAAHLLRFKVLV